MKVPDWMPEKINGAGYTGFMGGYNKCREDVLKKMPDYEAEIRRLKGVIRGYEQVINHDLSREESARFMQLFYARGGSSCPEDVHGPTTKRLTLQECREDGKEDLRLVKASDVLDDFPKRPPKGSDDDN